MPLGLDPDETADVSLDSDMNKPIDVRPTFQFRFLTCRQLRKVEAMRRKAIDEEDVLKSDQILADILMIGLAGWKNMGSFVFGKDTVDDVLTIDEKWELAFAYPSRTIKAERLKKASGSPSQEATDNSANPATEAPASTSQAEPAPSNSPTTPAPPAAEKTPAD